jgi:DNA-binding transcriptional ArsR family regulator
MYSMDNRTLKDLLYEQVARVGKALASPKRLEILEMLAQGEKAVETVAGAVGIDIKLASAHLKALKEARLVQVARRQAHDLPAQRRRMSPSLALRCARWPRSTWSNCGWPCSR